MTTPTTDPGNEPSGSSRAVAAFLRDRRDAILDEWSEAARTIRPAASLSKAALIDFLPRLLDRIADLAEELAEGRPAPELPHQTASQHALDRLDEGFDLSDVLAELSLLRDTVIRMWAKRAGAAERTEHRILDQAIDRAMITSVQRFVEARDRILRALDAISQTALEARDLDAFLLRLVAVLREHAPAVDTAVILLREGARLRVRAAAGLEEEVGTGFTVAIGEGFAGTIASERRSRALTSAATDPLVKSDALRAHGVRALYGVPLIDDGELLGVAHMGSRTASEFSHADRLLLESMASRATAAICQHALRDAVDQRAQALAESEARFRATFDNAAVGIAHLALDGRWLRLNRRYCEILGYSHDELVSKGWQELTHPDDVEDGEAGTERVHARERESYTAEKRYIRKDGTVVWVEVTVSVVCDGAGAPLYEIAVAQDITARKRTEEALRLSEERARLAMVAADLGTWDWTLPSGELELSDRCRAIFGLTSQSASYAQLVGLVAREDRGPFEAAIRRAVDSSHGWLARDQRIQRENDGQERWIAMRAETLFDERGRPVRMIGTALDITEERQMQQRMRLLADASALLASSLDYGETLRHIAEMVVPQIADWCIVDFVATSGELTEHVSVHRDRDQVERLRAIRRRWGVPTSSQGGSALALATGKPVLVSNVDEARLRAMAFDPEHLGLMRQLGVCSYVSVPLVIHDDERAGALTLAQAESGRRFADADVPFLEELARRASGAIENARLHEASKRAVEARDQILGIVSHDLRNPLGVIDMGTALLLETEAVRSDPIARRQAEAVQRSSSRMNRLIRDLLDMSSLQSGRLTLTRARHPLKPILAEARETLLGPAGERGIAIECELEVDDVELTIDRDRVLQVLSNLLGNAIKFSTSGGHVVLHASRRDDAIFISVRDMGPGIAEDDLPHIFDAYWHKGQGGTGLGLFISKGIVEAHGGLIGAETSPGAGSTFWFTLPMS